MAVRVFSRSEQPLLQFGLCCIGQIREAEALSQCGEVLVSGFAAAGKAADRVRGTPTCSAMNASKCIGMISPRRRMRPG